MILSGSTLHIKLGHPALRPESRRRRARSRRPSATIFAGRRTMQLAHSRGEWGRRTSRYQADDARIPYQEARACANAITHWKRRRVRFLNFADDREPDFPIDAPATFSVAASTASSSPAAAFWRVAPPEYTFVSSSIWRVEPPNQLCVYGEPTHTRHQADHRLRTAQLPELPGCREDCCNAAQNHRRQINPVAVFVHKALSAGVEGCGARVQGKVGVRVGAGSRNLRKNGLRPSGPGAHS